MIDLGTRNKLSDLVKTYQIAPTRDDIQMKALDCVGFLAFLYQLDRGAFEVTGFSDKGFLRFLTVTPSDTNRPVMIANGDGFARMEQLKLIFTGMLPVPNNLLPLRHN